jgi:pimeloyl-ACP methyl ester carboxylesterase
MARLRTYLRSATRFVGAIICIAAIALSAGAIYQSIAGNVDETRYKPPGRLVDVGGRRLHLYCIGSGAPAVILEAGLGWGLGTWRQVQPKVADTTQVCSYDRAGYGWSDVGPPPRTSKQIAEELHSLLQKGEVHGPYVLVGHSIGGLYLQYYAAKYATEVAGMVLVESSHQQEGNHPPSGLSLLAMEVVGATGLARLLIRYGDPTMDAVYSSNKTYATPFKELGVVGTSAEEVRNARLSLGDRPLIVLTAGRRDHDESWRKLQLDLLTLSSNSKRIVAEGSGHRIQNDQPDVVVAAIRDVVERSRGRKPGNEKHQEFVTNHR